MRRGGWHLASAVAGCVTGSVGVNHLSRNSAVHASSSVPLTGSYELVSVLAMADNAVADRQRAPRQRCSEVIEVSTRVDLLPPSEVADNNARLELSMLASKPGASSSSQAADSPANQPSSQPADTPRAHRVSGLLIYLEDGRMWTQLHVVNDNSSPASYTGYGGRWWVHRPVGGGCPPHGDRHLVEHYVKAASDPTLVGKTVVQQYDLSLDGKRLTTTDMQVFGGKVHVTEQLEWRRL